MAQTVVELDDKSYMSALDDLIEKIEYVGLRDRIKDKWSNDFG